MVVDISYQATGDAEDALPPPGFEPRARVLLREARLPTELRGLWGDKAASRAWFCEVCHRLCGRGHCVCGTRRRFSVTSHRFRDVIVSTMIAIMTVIHCPIVRWHPCVSFLARFLSGKAPQINIFFNLRCGSGILVSFSWRAFCQGEHLKLKFVNLRCGRLCFGLHHRHHHHHHPSHHHTAG